MRLYSYQIPNQTTPFLLFSFYRFDNSREAEKAEIERRRELTEEERVKEDMAYLAKKAKEAQAEKAQGSVEKYHHKGAFFMVRPSFLCSKSTDGITFTDRNAESNERMLLVSVPCLGFG